MLDNFDFIFSKNMKLKIYKLIYEDDFSSLNLISWYDVSASSARAYLLSSQAMIYKLLAS